MHQFRMRPFKSFWGWTKKHIMFPYPGIFQHPSLPQNFPFLPTSAPSYLTSFPVHAISRAQKSSWAWVAQSFEEMWNTRLEEGGEFNVEQMWKGEGKRSASSQMQKQEKRAKLPPFSTFFILCFKKKKCLGRKRCHCLLLPPPPPTYLPLLSFFVLLL